MEQEQKQKPIRFKISNKKTAVVSCLVIRDEVEKAMEIAGVDYPIFYPEKNLHDWPDKLRNEIQTVLNKIKDYDRVLLNFAFCGNAILGLQTRDFEMIIPRIDDCVSLLFGSIEKRKEEMGDIESIFFTKGMLEGEGGFNVQFNHMKEKRDEDTAWTALDMMYEHQNQITILDDGAFDKEEIIATVQNIAQRLDKSVAIKKTTIKKIEELLTGPWEEKNYLIIPNNHAVTEKDIYLQVNSD